MKLPALLKITVVCLTFGCISVPVLRAQSEEAELKAAMEKAERAYKKAKALYQEKLAEKKSETASTGVATEPLSTGNLKPFLGGFYAGYRSLYTPLTIGTGDKKIIIDYVSPVITDQAIKENVAKEEPGNWLRGTFRLRKGWNENKRFKYDPKDAKWSEDDAFLDPGAAEFSWSRDGLEDKDTWLANGVVFYPMPFFKGTPSAGDHPLFVMSPSVEFHRDTSKDGTDDVVDALVGRLGFDIDLHPFGIREDEACVVFRAAVGYQSDFDFESGKVFTEFELQPLAESLGLGAFYRAAHQSGYGDKEVTLSQDENESRWITHNITLKPIFTVGEILDDGDQAGLRKLGDSFCQAGGEVGLKFRLQFLGSWFGTAFSRTQIGASYRWWADLGSDSNTYDYFNAELELPILSSKIGDDSSDEEDAKKEAVDRMSVKAFYRKGDAPETLADTDLLGVSLGLRF